MNIFKQTEQEIIFSDILPNDVLFYLYKNFIHLDSIILFARTCKPLYNLYVSEFVTQLLPKLTVFINNLPLSKWKSFLSVFPRTFRLYTKKNYYYQDLIPIFYYHGLCGSQERFCKTEYQHKTKMTFCCTALGIFSDGLWTNPSFKMTIDINLEKDLKNYIDMLKRRETNYGENNQEYENKLINHEQTGKELPCKPCYLIEETNFNISNQWWGIRCIKDPIFNNFFAYVKQLKKIFIIHVLNLKLQINPQMMYPFSPFVDFPCAIKKS